MPTLVASLLAILAAVGLAIRAAHSRAAPRSAVVVALGAWTAIAGACWLLPALGVWPAPLLDAATWRLPDALLLPLQEGLSGQSVRQAAGGGAHAGDDFAALVELHARALTGGLPSLRSVVAMNVALSACNLGLFVAIARVALGSWAAALVAGGVWLMTRTTWLTALSEGPGALGSTLTLVAAVHAAVLTTHRAQVPGRGVRSAASVGLVCALAALASLRIEWLIFGVLGAGAWGLRTRYGAWATAGAPTWTPAIRAWVVRVTTWWERTTTRRGLSVAALVACVVLVSLVASPPLLVAINPLDPGPVYALLDAQDALSPLVVVLVAAGTLASLRQVDARLVLALAVLVLLKVYHASSHRGDPGELQRYLTGLQGALGLLALLGWAAVTRWVGLTWPDETRAPDAGQDGPAPPRAPPRRWLRSLLPPLAGLLAVPAPTLALWQRGALDRDDHAHLVRQLLAVGDQQREAQALFSLAQRHPRCAIATFAFRDDSVSAETAADQILDRVVVFGGPVRGVRDVRLDLARSGADGPRPQDVMTVIDAWFDAPVPCLIAFAGRDCELRPDRPGACAAMPDGPALVDERLSDRAWYSHVRASGGVRLRAAWLRPE